jgi:hypothetical protein
MENVKRIAVIGAGAAGLVTAEVFVRNGFSEVCVFEQRDEVGGVWNYSPVQVTSKSESVPNAMYSSLRTNLPKEVMAFNMNHPFPVNETGNSFLGHTEVFNYLRCFATKNNLLERIRFSTTVTKIYKMVGFKVSGDLHSKSCKWVVESMPTVVLQESHSTSSSGVTSDGKGPVAATSKDLFDAVIVCSGHFSVPFIPPAPPGFLEHFKGACYHSQHYDAIKRLLLQDRAESKRVLVVGSKSSGTDVARELLQMSHIAVFVSDRSACACAASSSFSAAATAGAAATTATGPSAGGVAGAGATAGDACATTTTTTTTATGATGVAGAAKNIGLPTGNPCQPPTHLDRLPPNLVLLPPIVRCEASSGALLFEDNSLVPDIDIVIWCTGYLYEYPFFPHTVASATDDAAATDNDTTAVPDITSTTRNATAPALDSDGDGDDGGDGSGDRIMSAEPPSCGKYAQIHLTHRSNAPIVVHPPGRGKKVSPLYQHLLSIDDPTLSFVGLPFRVVPFPLFYFQGTLPSA